jgi:hypothetical protein
VHSRNSNAVSSLYCDQNSRDTDHDCSKRQLKEAIWRQWTKINVVYQPPCTYSCSVWWPPTCLWLVSSFTRQTGLLYRYKICNWIGFAEIILFSILTHNMQFSCQQRIIYVKYGYLFCVMSILAHWWFNRVRNVQVEAASTEIIRPNVKFLFWSFICSSYLNLQPKSCKHCENRSIFG